MTSVIFANNSTRFELGTSRIRVSSVIDTLTCSVNVRINSVTNALKRNSFCGSDSHSTCQEFHVIYRNRSLIVLFTAARHWTISSLEDTIPRYSLICRNILILPQHECLFHAVEVDHPRRRTQSLWELQVWRRAYLFYFSGAYLFNDVLDKCAVMLLFIFGPVLTNRNCNMSYICVWSGCVVEFLLFYYVIPLYTVWLNFPTVIKNENVRKGSSLADGMVKDIRHVMKYRVMYL
jgi:hypothetical protein